MRRRHATNQGYFSTLFRTPCGHKSSLLITTLFLLMCGFIFSPDAFAQNSSAVASGLIGYWPGNGSGEDVVRRHDANLYRGINFVDGKFGKAFGFDGKDDCAVISSRADYYFDRNEGQFTLSCWVMPVPYEQPQAIISIASENNDMTSWFWGIYLHSQNRFVAADVAPHTPGFDHNNALTSKTIVKADTWYFVSLVFNQKNWKLYVNGAMEASLSSHSASISNDYYVNSEDSRKFKRPPAQPLSGSLIFGRSASGSKTRNFFQGLIDEVKLFNRALTSAEIKNLYMGITTSSDFSAPLPNPETVALTATGISERLVRQANGWTNVAISPDSKTLAGSDYEQTISFWDIASGKKRTSVKIREDDHSLALTSLAFSADGQTLAVGCGDGPIVFIDVQKGLITDSVRAPNGGVNSLSCSPDGNLLACGDGYGQISLWQFRTRQVMSIWKAGKGAVDALEFSPDGKNLASADSGGITTLWSISGQKIKDLTESERMCSLAFSSDSKTLAGGNERGAVKLWSLPNGELKHEWKLQSDKPIQGSLVFLDFSPNDEILAVGFSNVREGGAQLWDVQTGKVLRKLPLSYVRGLLFSPDGSFLATRGQSLAPMNASTTVSVPINESEREKISLWNLQANATQYRDPETPNQTLVAAQIPDSPQIPAAPSTPILDSTNQIFFNSNRDGNDEVYRMGLNDSLAHRLTNNPANDGGAVPGPDGLQVAFTSNRDGNLEVYLVNSDGSGEKRLTNTPANDIVSSWSKSGLIAFYSNRSGNYHIYYTNAKNEMLAQLTKGKYDELQPSFSPDSQSIAFSSNRSGKLEIYVMKANGTNIVQLTQSKASNHEPTWSLDGKKIVWSRKESGGNEDIYSMNADGSDQTRLTDYVGKDVRPTFSQNGDKIIFASNRDGNMEIYSMNPNGSNVIRLTNNLANDLDPSIGWITETPLQQE